MFQILRKYITGEFTDADFKNDDRNHLTTIYLQKSSIQYLND